MIINDNSSIIEGDGINDNDEQRIIDFIQGAVYCWCNNNEDKWFSVKNFVGRENWDWTGTPLLSLYDYYFNKLNPHCRLNSKKQPKILTKPSIYQQMG